MHESNFWDAYDDSSLVGELENIRKKIDNTTKKISNSKIEWLKKVAEAIEFEIDDREARNPKPQE